MHTVSSNVFIQQFKKISSVFKIDIVKMTCTKGNMLVIYLKYMVKNNVIQLSEKMGILGIVIQKLLCNV